MIGTKGLPRRGEHSWIRRASTPLPVPVSPFSRIVVSLTAAFSTTRRMRFIEGLCATRPGMATVPEARGMIRGVERLGSAMRTGSSSWESRLRLAEAAEF